MVQVWRRLSLRKLDAVGAFVFAGLLRGLTYQHTRSLRWRIFGYMSTDLFGLTALVLLILPDLTVG